MRRTWARWMIQLAAAVVLTGRAAHAAEADGEAVAAATAKFYAALNATFTGDMAPMKDVWSHADDVTYMGPGGGFQVGWDQVRANWEEHTARKIGGTIKPVGARTTIGQDLAVVSNLEEGENRNAAGQIEKVSIRATNIFRKEGGQWKMIGHHTDLLPFLK